MVFSSFHFDVSIIGIYLRSRSFFETWIWVTDTFDTHKIRNLRY